MPAWRVFEPSSRRSSKYKSEATTTVLLPRMPGQPPAVLAIMDSLLDEHDLCPPSLRRPSGRLFEAGSKPAQSVRGVTQLPEPVSPGSRSRVRNCRASAGATVEQMYRGRTRDPSAYDTNVRKRIRWRVRASGTGCGGGSCSCAIDTGDRRRHALRDRRRALYRRADRLPAPPAGHRWAQRHLEGHGAPVMTEKPALGTQR